MVAPCPRQQEFSRIEARRLAAGIDKAVLAERSGINRRSYHRMVKQEITPRAETLRKMRLAIRKLEAVRDQSQADKMIACVFRAHVLVIASELGLDGHTMLSVDPRDRGSEHFGDANRVRAMAAYMTVTGLDLQAIDVTAAVGVTKQAMSKWLPLVEDLRDDPAIDELLDRLAMALGTETGW